MTRWQAWAFAPALCAIVACGGNPDGDGAGASGGGGDAMGGYGGAGYGAGGANAGSGGAGSGGAGGGGAGGGGGACVTPGQMVRCGGCGRRTCQSNGVWGSCEDDNTCDTAAMVMVMPSDARLLYGGRWDVGGPRCNWSGSSIRFHATASEVQLAVADGSGEPGNPSSWRTNELTCYVDGVRTSRTMLTPNASETVVVLADLAAGPHVIECRKTSEAMRGVIQLNGLTLIDGALHQPIGWAHRVLFIGDSITAGAGNLHAPPCPSDAQNWEDTGRSYAGLVANLFDANTTIAAQSGVAAQELRFREEAAALVFGTHNAHGDVGLYDLPSLNASDAPELVVINLGTNDGGDSPGYRDAMRDLIQRLRSRFAAVPIMLLQGPLNVGFGDAIEQLKTEYSGIVRVDFPFNNTAVGCTSHPNLVLHQQLADTLATAVTAHYGWPSVQQW